MVLVSMTGHLPAVPTYYSALLQVRTLLYINHNPFMLAHAYNNGLLLRPPLVTLHKISIINDSLNLTTASIALLTLLLHYWIKWCHVTNDTLQCKSAYVERSIYMVIKKVCLEQNISTGSIHASLHNFHNVSLYVKWPQKPVMKCGTQRWVVRLPVSLNLKGTSSKSVFKRPLHTTCA